MTATLTNISKNRRIYATGGSVFYGWMFLFTVSIPGSGPTLTNTSKHSGSLTNQTKH